MNKTRENITPTSIRTLYRRSSTGVHAAPWGGPNYAWGAQLRKGASQTCHTKQTDTFCKTFS